VGIPHFFENRYIADVEGRRKKEEGRRKKEEGRRKKEEGRRKKEEGRRKKEERLINSRTFSNCC